MKRAKNKDARLTPSPNIEFYHFRLDRLIRVENKGAGVVIRIAEADLSEPEKLSLVRHLAAEGFIPDRFQSFSAPFAGVESGIGWIVDSNWVACHHKLARFRAQYSRPLLTLIGLFAVFLMAHFCLKGHSKSPAPNTASQYVFCGKYGAWR